MDAVRQIDFMLRWDHCPYEISEDGKIVRFTGLRSF